MCNNSRARFLNQVQKNVKVKDSFEYCPAPWFKTRLPTAQPNYLLPDVCKAVEFELFFLALPLKSLHLMSEKYTARTPFMKPTLMEWGGLTKRFQPVHQQKELIRAMLLCLSRTNKSFYVLCQGLDSILKLIVTFSLS